MRLFHLALLEQQVVVVCDDDELRIAVCELTIALLHPLEWSHVYVPTIPNDLLGLLSNPFPCILGLRTEQAAFLPQPRPPAMAMVHVDDESVAQLSMPSATVPPLPPREAGHLLNSLAAAAQVEGADYPVDAKVATAETVVAPPLEQLLFAEASSAENESALAGAAVSPAALEARTRGAFLRFIVSTLRDLHRFVPGIDGAEQQREGQASEGEPPDISDGVDLLIKAQPISSQPFLHDFARTQLFLSFVQTLQTDRASTGGRCFQLVRDAFLQRELSQAAEREQQHSGAPMPVSALLLGPAAKKVTSQAEDEVAGSAMVPPALYEVAPPAPPTTVALPAGASDGYRYPDGLPTTLPDEMRAVQMALPELEGVPPPAPRTSASVRNAWAEALAELEKRNQDRAGAQMAAGLGSSLLVGGAAATMLCTLQ